MEVKLKELGIIFFVVFFLVVNYVNLVCMGNLVFMVGKGFNCLEGGYIIGKLG